MKPLLFSVVLLLPACVNPSVAPQRETTVRALSPVRVTFEPVSISAHEAVALAKVERVRDLDLPFTQKLVLPAGVTLKEGRPELTLLPNTEAVTVTERYVFTFDAVPTDDALLLVDGETGAMGFHFKLPYRFGRPEPLETPPAATGPGLQRGDQKFGPSVPLK